MTHEEMIKITRRPILIGLLIVAAVLIAGCTGTPSPTPTTAPTPMATETPVAEPTPTPSPTATAEPSATPIPGDTFAVEAAKADLAQRYGISTSTISVVQTEPIQWPNSCLGVELPGTACAMHVVDGYRVILKTGGLQYEYHTNVDGSEVLAALAVVWHREGGIAGFCNDLAIDVTGQAIAFSCEAGPSTEVARQLLSVENRQKLDTWRISLQPFEYNQTDSATADAMSVQLSFTGYGTNVATNTQKRDISDFASAAYVNIGGLQGTGSAADAAGAVVDAFLTQLMAEPAGAATSPYFTGPLQTEIDAGQPVSELLAIPGDFVSYGIDTSEVEGVASRAFVQVTLNFVSPIRRAFELIQDNDIWKINTIIIYGVPDQTLPTDIEAADLEVLDLVWALKTGDLPSVEALLTPSALVELGDLTQLMQGVDNITALTLQLTGVSGGQAVYLATLQVDTASGSPSWQQGTNQRWIGLTQSGGVWQINQMTSSELTLP